MPLLQVKLFAITWLKLPWTYSPVDQTLYARPGAVSRQTLIWPLPTFFLKGLFWKWKKKTRCDFASNQWNSPKDKSIDSDKWKVVCEATFFCFIYSIIWPKRVFFSSEVITAVNRTFFGVHCENSRLPLSVQHRLQKWNKSSTVFSKTSF